MATVTTRELNAQFKAKEIPLDLIDPPAKPERETMDPEYLAELAGNIAEVGLIKPLVVKATGDRYEVVAGHRRWIACGIVKYSPVPCRVWVSGNINSLAILVAENAHTESVNPVEEARFYQRLLEEHCENDVDALCLMVRRRREYVEDRLLILRGDPRVTQAVQDKKISMAVARELNKIRDDNRRLLYLDVAINQGASSRQVMEWRRQSDTMDPLIISQGDTPEPSPEAEFQAAVSEMRCFFCEGTDDPHLIQYIALHNYCQRALNNLLQRSAAASVG